LLVKLGPILRSGGCDGRVENWSAQASFSSSASSFQFIGIWKKTALRAGAREVALIDNGSEHRAATAP
jgi:hypothetical protein